MIRKSFIVLIILLVGVAGYFGAKLYNADLEINNLSNGTITAADLNPYLGGIVRINCKNSNSWKSGSGSLWDLPNLGFTVLTNEHVIDYGGGPSKLTEIDGGFDAQDNPLPPINNACVVNLPGNGDNYYYVDLNGKYQWNTQADATDLLIKVNPGAYEKVSVYSTQTQKILLLHAQPVSDLDYSISNLRECPSTMPIGSPVASIGYPEFGTIGTSTLIVATTTQIYQITETGIISGIIPYDVRSGDILSYPNYFISAKSDSGDSGGIAFSKDSHGLCLLGVPTWINPGDYASEELIQNIRNIFLKE